MAWIRKRRIVSVPWPRSAWGWPCGKQVKNDQNQSSSLPGKGKEGEHQAPDHHHLRLPVAVYPDSPDRPHLYQYDHRLSGGKNQGGRGQAGYLRKKSRRYRELQEG